MNYYTIYIYISIYTIKYYSFRYKMWYIDVIVESAETEVPTLFLNLYKYICYDYTLQKF